jgi:uncharacterized protein
VVDEWAEDAAEGGDPVCWAHLVCPECGAMESEGHRAGCSAAPDQPPDQAQASGRVPGPAAGQAP